MDYRRRRRKIYKQNLERKVKLYFIFSWNLRCSWVVNNFLFSSVKNHRTNPYFWYKREDIFETSEVEGMVIDYVELVWKDFIKNHKILLGDPKTFNLRTFSLLPTPRIKLSCANDWLKNLIRITFHLRRLSTHSCSLS